MRMWIRTAALIAIVLAFANAQCLARCGTELCARAQPVHHCHEDPDSTPGTSCAHPQFALENSPGTAHVTLEAAETVLPITAIAQVLRPSDVSGDPPGDPPHIASSSLGVLRI